MKQQPKLYPPKCHGEDNKRQRDDVMNDQRNRMPRHCVHQNPTEILHVEGCLSEVQQMDVCGDRHAQKPT